MEQRTVTGVTSKMTTAQSRIRSELGNFPSGPTKFTVIHRRPIFFITAKTNHERQDTGSPNGKMVLANSMCRFAQHPVAVSRKMNNTTQSSRSSASMSASALSTSALVSSQVRKKTTQESTTLSRSGKSVLKRSLSADHLDIFQPAPPKRPFPVQIWFNNQPRGPRPLVSTAFWLDSPLHDSQAFVYTKLLEASQARRYLRLQSKPRKYLHLTSGWIVAVSNPPPSPRKPEFMLPPMTVKILPQIKTSPAGTVLTQKPQVTETPTVSLAQPPVQSPRKKSPSTLLPPPPPLISLRPPPPLIPKVEETVSSPSPPPLQEHPLELCKRRKHSDETASSPDSPRLVIKPSTSTSSALNLTVNIKRKIALPSPFSLPLDNSRNQQEPLDLATPSPTTVFQKMTLTDSSSDSSPLSLSNENFRRRLILVLQVLLGKRRLTNLGHPETPIEDILSRILKKAGIVPDKNSEIKNNWMKFLRLCVKNEDAWKREGWDRKSPDAVLDEIYMQGDPKVPFSFLYADNWRKFEAYHFLSADFQMSFRF